MAKETSVFFNYFFKSKQGNFIMKLVSKLLSGAALAVALSNSASAATLNITNGTLMSATGVNVGGALYDVTFGDEVVSSSSITAFTDKASADKASQSLLDQVLKLVAGKGTYVNGVTTPYSFIVRTAHSSNSAGAIFTSNANVSEFFGTYRFSVATENNAFDTGTNTSRYTEVTMARWSLSGAAATATAVPEPEAYAMMLAGLGLVGFAARRKLAA